MLATSEQSVVAQTYWERLQNVYVFLNFHYRDYTTTRPIIQSVLCVLPPRHRRDAMIPPCMRLVLQAAFLPAAVSMECVAPVRAARGTAWIWTPQRSAGAWCCT